MLFLLKLDNQFFTKFELKNVYSNFVLSSLEIWSFNILVHKTKEILLKIKNVIKSN